MILCEYVSQHGDVSEFTTYYQSVSQEVSHKLKLVSGN